jgi:hypothetical protein
MKTNPYPYNTQQYWEWEANKHGRSDVTTYIGERMRELERSAPKCPVCGTAKGFSFGTGDCACLG